MSVRAAATLCATRLKTVGTSKAWRPTDPCLLDKFKEKNMQDTDTKSVKVISYDVLFMKKMTENKNTSKSH